MESESERRQRLYRVRGVVLRRRDTGEADRLLTVLARERGKLTLLAKGVRRPASRKAGHIEPFTYVDLLVARGRSLDIVTQAETLEAHRSLREDLWRSGWAYYACELADAFTQEADPNEILFDLLLETLARLDRGEDPTLAMRYYEMHLLGLAGYQPQLFRCLECGTLLKPEVNYLSLERGGALCPAHGAAQEGTLALPLPAFKVLRYLQTRPWEQVVKVRLSPQLGQQVETILNRYIIYHLERNLSSPAFIQRLRQQRRLAGEYAAPETAAEGGAGPAGPDEADEDPGALDEAMLDEACRGLTRRHWKKKPMHIREYQSWLEAWDRERGWDRVDPAHTLVHALEEMGEVARLVLRYEGYKEAADPEALRADLAEEMSDLFVFLFKLAYQTGIDVEEALAAGQDKANARYPDLDRAGEELARYHARQADLKRDA